jgi:hypothetical protein
MRDLTPKELEDLNNFVGQTGGKPNYRIKFAPDLLVMIGGDLTYKYPDLDAEGEEIRPKPLYVLEIFKTPDFFGNPKEWNELDNGPFPENGDYVYRAFLGNENGGFLEICELMFELVMATVTIDRAFQNMPQSKKNEYIAQYFQKKANKKAQTRKEKLDALNSDSMDRQERQPINPVSSFPAKVAPVNLASSDKSAPAAEDKRILSAGQTAPQTIILPSTKEINEYAR